MELQLMTTFDEALRGTHLRHLLPEKRIAPTSAPKSVGQGRLASTGEISKATSYLFGNNYKPDNDTTQMMIDLLTHNDQRGNSARMFAKDDCFAAYLIDMITGYRKLLTNGTIKHV